MENSTLTSFQLWGCIWILC